MAGYDPKRPRPTASPSDEPAPVDALLEPLDEQPDEPEVADGAGAGTDPVEVDLREAGSGGPTGAEPAGTERTTSRGASTPRRGEVPVAAAPEEGTTNRAVLIAVVTAAVASLLAIAVVLRSRRHRH